VDAGGQRGESASAFGLEQARAGGGQQRPKGRRCPALRSRVRSSWRAFGAAKGEKVSCSSEQGVFEPAGVGGGQRGESALLLGVRHDRAGGRSGRPKGRECFAPRSEARSSWRVLEVESGKSALWPSGPSELELRDSSGGRRGEGVLAFGLGRVRAGERFGWSKGRGCSGLRARARSSWRTLLMVKSERVFWPSG
jgi:hypothetical protein